MSGGFWNANMPAVNFVYALAFFTLGVAIAVQGGLRQSRFTLARSRETWTVLHGLILGTLFLLAFGGGLAGLWSLRPELVTPEGIRERMGRLVAGTWVMAVTAWLTVFSGTFVVYPWYRAKTPDSPRSLLLAKDSTKLWHEFGMEWKEHVAWIAPILATAVAYIVWYYGRRLAHEDRVRKVAMVLYSLAFVAAGVAGVFGAFLNKMAPTR